ncbi:MAG: right-handed parallel beta-helix repeat-containing protein, partial [Desulfurococcales archaeon]|nr:right-handed parallel beta-helix repeat-containing protein [Desulfurococcales archaeon]
MKYNLIAIILVLLVLTLAPIGYPVANNIHITKASTPTVITSLPYTITTPGVYVLSSNLSTSSDGILVESDDVVIIGNGFTITGSGVGGGINISGHVNVTITNLTLRNFWAGINVSNLTSLWNYAGVKIDNVRIEDCWEGILIWYVDAIGGVIINNTLINGSLYYGIDAYEVTDLYILNTIINGSNDNDYGIYLDSSEGVYIYNTTITNTHYTGIYVDSYYDYGYNTVTIVRSTIANTYDYGIEIDNGEGVLILYSNISNNYYSGIYVRYSSYVWLYQNVIENNDEYGVYVYYSSNVYINSSVISNNSYSGIYLDVRTSDVSIWGNQIIYNDDYGVEADTPGNFNVTRNTFGGNSMHPQAYDSYGSGNWTGNYWSDLTGSTYSFSYNQDPAPLSDPLPFIWILDVSAPRNATYGSIVDVNVTITNLGYGPATDSLIGLYWGEPLRFVGINYTWIDVDPFAADNVSDGDIVEDFGNYTLWDEDDGYIIY